MGECAKLSPMAPPSLMQHQKEGVLWLKETPNALLADEPGLGKSAQLLLAAVEPILVLAPAMVLDSGTWDDEIARWRPDATVTQAPYSMLNAREKTGKGSGTKPLGVPRPEYGERHWGTVIADESHYLKGRKTSWTLAAQALSTDRFFQATGTPIPNWAHEAFVGLQLIHPKESKPRGRFGSYWRWVESWFQVTGSQWNAKARDIGDLLPDRTWDEFYFENWGDHMRRRLRADCLDLPPLTLTRWDVPMGAQQKRVYHQLRKDFVAWLDSGQEVVAWNAAAQLVKLAKIATGLEVLDPASKSSGKIAALKTILVDRARPTLVVAHFRDSVAACAAASISVGQEAAVIDGATPKRRRLEIIRSFQRGDLPTLCASIETVAEGMTLHQGGADQVIRVERSAKPSKNEQVIRRLHRLGVEVPIQVIDLVTAGTVDERILALLAEKTDQQMAALGPGQIRELVS